MLLRWLLLPLVAATDPKFKVSYNGHLADGPYDTIRIDNSNTNLSCYIPQVNNITMLQHLIGDKDTPETPQRSDGQLLDEIIPKFLTYLDSHQCFFTAGLNEGYWTYGYCFGDKVIQFHENMAAFHKTGVHQPEFPNHVFVLGRFDGSNSKDPKILNQSTTKSRTLHKQDFSIINDPYKTSELVKRPQKALSHVLSNGGWCDLTNEPRTIEIVYRCAPDMDFPLGIASVSEVKTCDYQMIVNVRGLCGVPEFAPSNMEEKIVDVVCTNNTEQSPGGKTFPQPKSTTVDIQDFKLQAAGNGFFWGRPKSYDGSEDLYDRRSVVFYNDVILDERRFIHDFSRMYSNSMEFKIRSPNPASLDQVATWDDFFTAWYEIYDENGRFFKVMKVARSGSVDTKGLNLQLVDPFKMTDQDGDPVKVPVPGERNIYEYERFNMNHPETMPQDDPLPEQSTITVTEYATEDKQLGMEDVLEVLRERLGIDENDLYELMDQELDQTMDPVDPDQGMDQDPVDHDEL